MLLPMNTKAYYGDFIKHRSKWQMGFQRWDLPHTKWSVDTFPLGNNRQMVTPWPLFSNLTFPLHSLSGHSLLPSPAEPPVGCRLKWGCWEWEEWCKPQGHVNSEPALQCFPHGPFVIWVQWTTVTFLKVGDQLIAHPGVNTVTFIIFQRTT